MIRPRKSSPRRTAQPLSGHIALVVGATRGAGRGIARALGEAGAMVYCTGRNVRGHPSPYGRPETIEDTRLLRRCDPRAPRSPSRPRPRSSRRFTDSDGRRPDWGALEIDFSRHPPALIEYFGTSAAIQLHWLAAVKAFAARGRR